MDAFGYFFLIFNTTIIDWRALNLWGAIAIFLLLACGKISLTIYVVLEWMDEYYEVFQDHMNYVKGVFYKTKRRIAYEDIENIHIEQGVVGKLLNFGTIRLFNWKSQKYEYLYQVHNPMRYYHVFEKLMPKVDREEKTFKKKLIEQEQD